MKPESTIEEIERELAGKAQLEETTEDDRDAARRRHKEKEATKAIKRYRELLAERAAEESIIDDFRDQISSALGSKLVFRIDRPTPLPKRKGAPEEANLVISDSHVWKIVEPQHTLGFGDYNPWIFLERLHHLEQSVVRMLQQNITNPVQRLNIMFLGDLVEGMLNHSEEIPGRGFIADQVLLASTAFYQFVARLSRVVPVTVRGVCGNHSRNPNQQKPPTHGRWSSFDFIVLGQIQQLVEVSGIDNIEVALEENAFQVFPVLGWRIKIGHGDHLKGGDRALGIPAHAMAREINATTQRYSARLANGLQRGTISKLGDVAGSLPPDYYLVGDKHRHISAATARGRFMVNGAFFQDCEYAMTANFAPDRPFQMFFGIHERIGKSWSYDMMLDMAPKLTKLPYALPERLADKVSEFAP